MPVAVNAPVTKSPKTTLMSRPVLGVVSFFALVGICEIVPALKDVRLLNPPARPDEKPSVEIPPPTFEVGEAKLESETHERPELAQPETVTLPKNAKGPIAAAGPAGELPAIDAEKPPVPMQNTEALSGFYAALSKTIRKETGAVTRIVHFGDSIVTSDYVSGTLRRKLQKQFGDGGHGFMLMANAWPAYFHNDVSRFASSGWLVSRIVGPMTPDGLYGLGGVTFRAPPGSRARFGTAKSGSFGRNVSRFIVVYLREPGGGTVALNLDGKPHSEIVTDGPEKKVAYQEVKVPDGAHELEVVTKKGVSRAFGVIMERDGPGIVLDAIGIQGARVRFLDKQDDAHWAEQLQSRKANLLVYEFGANESGDGFAYPMVDYNRTLKEVLRQGKKALPNAGCLIIGAMDRAEKKGTSLQTMAIIPALVKEQKQAAAEVGCAFFDTYQAMGGAGSMAGWVGRGLGQADLTHPSGVGSEVIANWIYRALVQGYEEYRTKSK